MSDRTPRVSRRTLLKVSGLAPITALVASGASSAEIAAAAACLTNVENPASHVLEKARKVKDVKLDEPLFSQVVWLLWLNFVAGTKPSRSPIENEVAIIEQAYDMPTNATDLSPSIDSGDKIVKNLAEWKKEDIDIAAATNWCAYQVGLEAGDQAKGTPITVVHFAKAWGIVADKTKGLFEKWERVGRKNGEDKPLKIRGVGC